MKLFKLVALGSVLAATGILSANYFEDAALARDREQRYKRSRKCITRKEVIKAQKTWGNAIVAIGKANQNGGDFKGLAEETVDNLYAYDEGNVLFKPTLASEQQFRLTEEDALSYFVGGDIPEDTGFALRPWSNVRFENAAFSLNCKTALAMGNYYFTDAKTGEETKVEFSFGYIKNKDGKLLIILQDSSFPFNPEQ